ncbi:hypothetical protein [Fulvivirga aurantia]|uniref:hypothetical protein n=1 Tax=Fulvivirga aurantia TaxID=2529383 RepID=UPI0012BBA578|nr:hypothetical protein [Fulvivirga aurantia]
MQNYKFFKKGTFESFDKFEKRLNEETSKGWKPLGFTNDHGHAVVLLERVR